MPVCEGAEPVVSSGVAEADVVVVTRVVGPAEEGATEPPGWKVTVSVSKVTKTLVKVMWTRALWMLAEEVVSSARGVIWFLGWSVLEPMVEAVARATAGLEVGREMSLLSSIVAGCCFVKGSHERRKAGKERGSRPSGLPLE